MQLVLLLWYVFPSSPALVLKYVLIAGFLVCFQFIKSSFSTCYVASMIDSIYPQNHWAWATENTSSFQCNYPRARGMTAVLLLRPICGNRVARGFAQMELAFSLLVLLRLFVFVWQTLVSSFQCTLPHNIPVSAKENRRHWNPEAAHMSLVSNIRCLYLLLLATFSFPLTINWGRNSLQSISIFLFCLMALPIYA